MKGLIFGKFLPPHRGHIDMIEYALAHTGLTHLNILVCALPDLRFGQVNVVREEIPGIIRAGWLREYFLGNPRVTVHLVEEENPQKPDDHSIFWEIWSGVIKQWAGSVDIIFTSEEYGETLKGFLGAEHIKVDGWRVKNQLSGHEILANPEAYWHGVMPFSRPWLIKRIVFIGAESTGKTVTSLNVALHLGAWRVGEAGQDITEEVLSRGGLWKEDDFSRIFSMQKDLEEAAALRSDSPFLICDTDAIQTVAWYPYYLGREAPVWMQMAARQSMAHLYLLMYPTIPWINDGTRRFKGSYRDSINQTLQTLVRSKGTPIGHISEPDLVARGRHALAIIGNKFGKYKTGFQG